MSRPKNNLNKKLCLKCNTIKNKKEFYIHKACRYTAWCKECTKKQAKKYRIENPDKIKALKKKYKEIRKEVRKPSERRYYLKRKYKITEIDYRNLYNKQNGKCILCNKKFAYGKLCIDHCHTFKKIRGLLCNNCNLGLGNFKDNIEVLKKAIYYLKKNQLKKNR